MNPESLPPEESDGRFHYSYRLPTAPPSDAVPITFEEAEKDLISKIQPEDPVDGMWNLAQFYKQTGNVERASEVFRALLEKVESLEVKAQVVMALGQTAEKAQDFELAVRFYKEAVRLEPCDTLVWYFIHNNLGYSLNQLGRFAEGETYCRRALQITTKLPNAFKNLGLSLVGQGRYADAAKCFVAATQADAADPRSTRHLEELLSEHPELEFEFGHYLVACKAAVEAVRKKAQERSQGTA